MTQLPRIPYTTLSYLRFEEEVLAGMSSHEREGAVKMLNWLVSRLEDEADENLAHDHFHPEIAGPLQGLRRVLVERMEEAGLTYTWVRQSCTHGSFVSTLII